MRFKKATPKYHYEEEKRFKRINVTATVQFPGCSEEIIAYAHGKTHDDARNTVDPALVRAVQSHVRSCRSGVSHE